MANYFDYTVSEETFASWLDGTLSPKEEDAFLEHSAHNTDVQNLLDANDQVDASYENMIEGGYELPEELLSDFEIPEIPLAADDDIEEYTSDDIEPYDMNLDNEEEESSSYTEHSDYCTDIEDGNDGLDQADLEIL